MDHCPITALAQELIRCPSLTPEDAGCQAIVQQRLHACNFTIESFVFGNTKNFWAWHGEGAPCFVFVGHTDVVPPGDVEQWRFPPFVGQVADGVLYGRGAADMKGAIAAMVIAIERFIAHSPHHRGRLALLITADEEGEATQGTIKVVEALRQRGEAIDYCLVGEPTSQHTVGDVIKHGRRGSLTGQLSIQGVQGHVAYPHLALNPIHCALPLLQRLATMQWDQGSADFPATTFQIVNLQAGTGATNVIPAVLQVKFNFRYNPESTAQVLKQRVERLLHQQQLEYRLEWKLHGEPFLTPQGRLLEVVCASVHQQTQRLPILSTAGGTSDGRFVATLGAQVVELGLLDATIHQANEQVRCSDLQQLSRFYYAILGQLLGRATNGYASQSVKGIKDDNPDV